MNYKNIVLCFIVLFSSVKIDCNETIVDYFNIDKTDILALFTLVTLVAIVAFLYDDIVNNFNTLNYIITYLKFYIFNFDPNIQDEYYGWTPLYSACFDENIKAIKLLLAHPDINPNIKNNLGWTPLYSSCVDKRVEAIKLLLSHPTIDPNI